MANSATSLPSDVRYDTDGGPIGWMNGDELAWLRRQAAGAHRVVEVGVWQGRTTMALAASCPGKVVAVDNWVGESGSPVPDLEDRFRDNLKDEIRAGKVVVLSMASVAAADWARSWRTLPDMVFIDGNHEYPAPLHDIFAWRAALRPGGLLCGHDLGQTGVNQSLDELPFASEPVGAGSIWRLINA